MGRVSGWGCGVGPGWGLILVWIHGGLGGGFGAGGIARRGPGGCFTFLPGAIERTGEDLLLVEFAGGGVAEGAECEADLVEVLLASHLFERRFHLGDEVDEVHEPFVLTAHEAEVGVFDGDAAAAHEAGEGESVTDLDFGEFEGVDRVLADIALPDIPGESGFSIHVLEFIGGELGSEEEDLDDLALPELFELSAGGFDGEFGAGVIELEGVG